MKARALTPKVFCIGFHKTGTTTMGEALEILGYRVTGPNGTKDPDIATTLIPMVERLAVEYDAFQDNPWPLVYRRMDMLFPGSKFILTLRDEDKWYKSTLDDFGERDLPMRALIYGPGHGHPAGNEAVYKRRMRRHNAEVREHFRERPHDLFTMELARDAGWDGLCAFLGKPVPARPFPHSNTKRQVELRRRWGGIGRIAGRFIG